MTNVIWFDFVRHEIMWCFE